MATGDLVSLSEVQAAYPDLTANQVTDMPAIISAVSAEIAGRYPRASLSTTYDETVDPGINRTIRLAHYPVLRVQRVRTDMSTVITINRTGSVRNATVEVVTTGEPGSQVVTSLVLKSETGGIVSTDATLLFSTYTTVGTLVTAINGIGGWLAVIGSGQTDMATLDLEPGQGVRSTVTSTNPQTTAPVRVWGYIRDLNDYALENPSTGVMTIHENHGDSYRFPDRTWGQDARTTVMRVIYDAGRSVAPADVKRAAILIIGDVLQVGANIGPVAPERNQDYAVTLKAMQTATVPPVAARMLSRYKDRRFA